MSFSLKPSLDLMKKFQDPKNPEPVETLPVGTVWVDFNGDETMGIKTVRTFAQHIDQKNFFTGILITAAPVSAACYKLAATVAPRIIEIFNESDLVVNITMHELVPKHVVLSKEEKQKLLERYRLKESQLPRIQLSDPVARYLGLRRGQVVKIVRRSTTAGRYASYRWCL
jgi:DNA-directed RNA polymerase I, II, and III subunit RPABC1